MPNAVVSDRGIVVELKRNANDVLLYKTTVGHCREAKALEAAKMGIEIDWSRRFKSLYVLIACKINNKFETPNDFVYFYANVDREFRWYRVNKQVQY